MFVELVKGNASTGGNALPIAIEANVVVNNADATAPLAFFFAVALPFAVFPFVSSLPSYRAGSSTAGEAVVSCFGLT